MAETKTVTLNVAPAARTAVRAFQAAASGAVGKMLNTSEALILACAIATPHLMNEAVSTWENVGDVMNGEKP